MALEHDPPAAGIEQLADLVFVVDGDATIRSVNGAIRRVLGFEPSDRIGTSALELIHPDDVGVAAETLVGTTGATEGSRRPIVVRAACADGSWRRLELVANNLLADEQVRGITIVAREVVTSEHEARADRETERRLDAAFDGASIGMALVGTGGRFIRVNAALCRLLGCSRDELIGRIAADLTHPEELDTGLETLDAIASGRLQTHEDERRMLRRDGTYVWVRTAISAVRDDAGRPLYFATQVIDLSERVAAEEALRAQEQQYRLIVESTDQGVWLIDRNADTVFVNPRVGEMLGYGTDEIVGKHIFEFMEADAQAEASANLAGRREGVRDRHTFRLRHARGHDVWVDVDSSPLTDADGEYAGAITLLTDVTEERHVEAALRHERERFRTLVQESADLIVVATADGTIDYASPAVRAVLGYRPDELRGRMIDELLVDPAEGVSLRSDTLASSARRGAPLPFELRMKHRDGSTRDCEVVARNLIDDPSVRGIVVNARDITERTLQAAALRDAEDRFAAAFERSPVAIAVIGFDGLLIDCNEAYSEIVGIPVADLLGTDSLACVHPDDAERAVEASAARIEEGSRDLPPPAPIRMRRPDGAEVWVRFDSQMVKDTAGDPAYVVATMFDITEQKDAQERLHHSEQWFRTLVQSQSDIVTVIGFDGVLSYVSPNCERVLGFAPDEMVGTSGDANVHPDDFDRLMASLAEQIAAGADPQPVEYRQRRADGSWVWLEATVRLMPSEYGNDSVIVTARDVGERRRAESEHREAEARFREAFASSPIGIGFADLDGRLTWVNRALSVLVGIPEEQLRQTQFQELSRVGELEGEIEQTSRLLRGEIDAFESEKRYEHPDGRTVWGLLHVSLVRDAGGEPAQLLGQVEDITERKQRELLLAHDAHHDNLTGLWNRVGFRRLAADVWTQRTAAAPVALLFADLDRFKRVNDDFGHSAGDEVLANVARRLQSAVRSGDTVARWGGDEFVVLCPSVTDADEAGRIAQRVRRALSLPFRFSSGVATIGVSIGIALDDGHHSPQALLDDADAASYRAKGDLRHAR